ncbi:MAG: hypothetical protein BCS36_01795 [Desulfovibrio sp. MES5]|nr:MAG: hypothetical protein BCS36_01795 [Desulfovibrio sp. MES5]
MNLFNIYRHFTLLYRITYLEKIVFAQHGRGTISAPSSLDDTGHILLKIKRIYMLSPCPGIALCSGLASTA